MGGLFKQEKPIGNIRQYELLELLSKTPESEIYRARRQGSRDSLVLKLLLFGDPERDRRLLRAIPLLLQLEHPAILRLEDWGTDEDRHYFVSEPPGKPLEIPPGGGAPKWVLQILTPICEAVAFLHERGLIHRDIRPAAIAIGPDGPRLVDFSLLRPEEKRAVTRIGSRVGTPAYMPPEQVAASAATPASDQYSLGVLAYQLLTGRLPFEGDEGEQMQQHVRADADVTGVPAGPVLARMLAKDPGQRFPDVTAALAALKSALS